MTSKVIGKTTGVGKDIIAFLTTVAKHFNLTIVITSGVRDPASQANAMYNNWIKLDRGMVYKKSTLPEIDRKKLDDFYNISVMKPKTSEISAQEIDKAKQDFLTLAAKTKSVHFTGRAIDIARGSLSHAAHLAILWKMREVKEGKRNDICHFESISNIPVVSDDDLDAHSHSKIGKKPAPHAHAPGHPGKNKPQTPFNQTNKTPLPHFNLMIQDQPLPSQHQYFVAKSPPPLHIMHGDDEPCVC